MEAVAEPKQKQWTEEEKSAPIRVYMKHGPQYRDGWINWGTCEDETPRDILWPTGGTEDGGFPLINMTEGQWPTTEGRIQEMWVEDVLHQIPQGEVVETLKYWRGLLRREDSTLTVEVMDVAWACRMFLEAPQPSRWADPTEDSPNMGLVYALVGPQKCGHPCGEFRSLYDAQRLYGYFLEAGFVNVQKDPTVPNADRRIRIIAERGEL